MIDLNIRPLDDDDKAYALVSWRESHHQAPEAKRMPWSFYKERYGRVFEKLLADGCALGAYSATGSDELFGFLVVTRGVRVHTVHWAQTKFKDAAGTRLRRQGIMMDLLAAADLGPRFVYTLQARKEKGKTLDKIIVEKLQKQETYATYVPMLEWLK